MSTKRRILLVALLLFSFGSYEFIFGRYVSGTVSICGWLTVELPIGSKHRILHGIDSQVGSVRIGWNGPTIFYDLYRQGELEGDVPVVTHEVHDGVPMNYGIREIRGERTLAVTFPTCPAGFFYKGADDPQQIERILAVLRTVRPVPR